MNATQVEQLITTLQHEFGADLRAVVVAPSDGQEYDVRYIRDDIAVQYDEASRKEFCDEFVCDRLLSERPDNQSTTLGELQVAVRKFEQGITLVTWYGDTALLLGFSPDVSVISPAIRICQTINSGGS